MRLAPSYLQDLLKEHNLTDCRKVTTTGSQLTSDNELLLPEDWDETAELGKFRRLVGKLQWMVTVRPDIAFAVKTLA